MSFLINDFMFYVPCDQEAYLLFVILSVRLGWVIMRLFSFSLMVALFASCIGEESLIPLISCGKGQFLLAEIHALYVGTCILQIHVTFVRSVSYSHATCPHSTSWSQSNVY